MNLGRRRERTIVHCQPDRKVITSIEDECWVQGEMSPAMGEIKKGEMRRIEQNWECDACGRIVTLPFT